MHLSELQQLGSEIDDAYIQSGKDKGYGVRTPLVYLGFLMTDLGELAEQVMAKEGYRDGEDIDKKIEHELADVLWAVLMLGKHLNVDMEKSYTEMVKVVKDRQARGTAG
ncbi:MAG: MazG nucleotide pyrophosphohydrolase domain-containing protein [Candidatus Paceibacterota bacterium]